MFLEEEKMDLFSKIIFWTMIVGFFAAWGVAFASLPLNIFPKAKLPKFKAEYKKWAKVLSEVAQYEIHPQHLIGFPQNILHQVHEAFCTGVEIYNNMLLTSVENFQNPGKLWQGWYETDGRVNRKHVAVYYIDGKVFALSSSEIPSRSVSLLTPKKNSFTTRELFQRPREIQNVWRLGTKVLIRLRKSCHQVCSENELSDLTGIPIEKLKQHNVWENPYLNIC